MVKTCLLVESPGGDSSGIGFGLAKSLRRRAQFGTLIACSDVETL